MQSYSDIPTLNCQEILDYFESLGGDTLSAIWVPEGKIEWSLSSVAGLNFREEVFAFNKKVSRLCKAKPVNIYLGYDSSHGEVFDTAEKSIYNAVALEKWWAELQQSSLMITRSK